MTKKPKLLNYFDQRKLWMCTCIFLLLTYFFCECMYLQARVRECALQCTSTCRIYIMSIYDLTYKNTQLKALYRDAFNIDIYGFWKFQQLQKSSRRFS